MPKASIITIGDELLIGQVIDTNSAFIAQEFNHVGLLVQRRVAVGDVWDEIWNALEEELKKVDIVIITGGLGPTADDITKPLLCKFFKGEMIVDEASKQNVIDIFTKLNRPIIERNLKQAEVPSTCKALVNKRGTAPGMWFERDGKVIVSLPGVPHEMKSFILEDVIPMLLERFVFPNVEHCTLLTAGVGESFLAEMLIDFEASLPAYIKMAYLPNYGLVRLRLTGVAENKIALKKELQDKFISLQGIVKEFLITDKDESIDAVIARLLLEKSKTLVTAESCTGGYIAEIITARSGSSAYFNGAVVAYSNGIKEQILQVNTHDIVAQGAVSKTVAEQMATNARVLMQSDYAISVTGIMGPNGGTEAKPVGLVWIAVASANIVVAEEFRFRFDRVRNIQLTSNAAFFMLRKLILAEA